MSADTEVFYVLLDEVEQAWVGTQFVGTSVREDGTPVLERVAFFGDYTDDGVVRFKSPEAADNWLAPSGGYERSRATLVRVTVEYTAEAV
jgi:hypothetical protein